MTTVLQQISTQEPSRYSKKLGNKGKELRVAVVTAAVILNNSCSYKRQRIWLDGETFNMKMCPGGNLDVSLCCVKAVRPACQTLS